MNLNTIKRGFSRTQPEKGLSSLPGAQKNPTRLPDSTTVRVKGVYISEPPSPLGKICSISAFCLACGCNLILLVLATLWVLPLETAPLLSDYLLSYYVVFAAILHGFAIVADGTLQSNAPWARKGLIMFWCGGALFLALVVPALIALSLIH